jgi:hypothetical protein
VAGENELSQASLPGKAFREADIPGIMDCSSLNEAANLNLVPLVGLPRRARHKNEQARLFGQ